MRDAALRPGRFHESDSSWVRSFSLAELKILVVCRGPVRREAFDVFDEIGIREYGMLLSEKDSVVYPRCLAPELRGFRFPANVHRVPDYMGAGQEEKQERIRDIVEIARAHEYTHVFAGYGFMAEDAEFIEAVEGAGLGFIGPSSKVVRRAGAKDEAKKLARRLGNAVIPGVEDLSARALLRKAAHAEALRALAREAGLSAEVPADLPLEEQAEAILQEGYLAGVELVDIGELQAAAEEVCKEIWSEYPSHRIRFKHIGGGGGKGQRVVAEPEEVPAAVMDVLAESKVVQPGSNRNFLVELNIERTRHNEIQLLGNGHWCISLGGRDCSIQMHEQKLMELSLTREMLQVEAERAEGRAREILQGDRRTLERMEREAERFGEATGLDSVSTFECIVDGFDHFFMEMNTRIQVEHGVTELVYRLRFENPDDPRDAFHVDRLIEAMVLLAAHGERLPRPARLPLSPASLEVRINATDPALQPHAGGLIKAWSPPIEGELRFDQGIGARNPDTGWFVFYNLAGAYDSNIALVLSHGDSREESFQRMAEILRRMEIRGDDLHTNLDVHYGLVQWLVGRGVMAEPTTHFMRSYLAAVGALQQVARELDLDLALAELGRRLPDGEARAMLAAKETLLLRPLQRLLGRPHALGGFLGRFDGELWRVEGEGVVLRANPADFLTRLYEFLDMEERPQTVPAEKIWDHDQEILEHARGFYAEVARRTGVRAWPELEELFAGPLSRDLCGGDPVLWERCRAFHRGFRVGMELLLLLPRIGCRSGFLQVGVAEDLRPVFPERFRDPRDMARSIQALAPLPPASADEIVAPSGGTFYAREAPHLPALVEEGDHFETGQPLFVIEVMKMFNKVRAPFPGTVVENRMRDRDGTVVKKGEVIFKIEPDQRASQESPEAARERVRAATLALLELEEG